MDKDLKKVKIHFCFKDRPEVSLCGLEKRGLYRSSVSSEVTCNNCIRKLKGGKK